MNIRTIVGLAATGTLAGAAGASVHFVSQDNVVQISYSDPLFADARIDGNNTLASTADAAGDSVGIGWGFYTNPLLNQHVSVSGGVTVDTISIGGGISYVVHHPAGAPGSHTYFYTRLQPDGAGFSAQPGGVLHFEASSSPQVPAGAPFSWTLTIPGDWSSQGHGPGQTELLSLGADWIVTQNFAYDAGTTTFSMRRAPGSPSNVVFAVNFHAVPAPSGACLLTLAALAAVRRRRS